MTLNLDKSNWKHVAFGDVVTNLNVTVKDPETAGIDRVIAMEHLDPGELQISRWGSLDDGTTFTRRVKPGQTLFGKRRAYQRKAAYAEFAAICSSDILVFEADKDRLLPEFLPFMVQSNGFYNHALGTSAGSLSPRTNWRDLANYEFDLPPLDEQKRLSDLLWSIERHAQRLKIEGSEIEKAYEAWLNSRLAGLSRSRLDSVVQLQLGRPVLSSLYGDEGVPLLRPGDMKSDGVTAWTDSTVRVPTSFADDNSRWVLAQGDLVINMTAQSLEDRFLGRVCRVHGTAVLNQRIGRFLLAPGINADFLHIVLRAPEFSNWAMRKCEGSKVKHLHWRHIQDYPLPLPEIPMQERIGGEAVMWSEASEAVSDEIQMVTTASRSVLSQIFGV